MSKYIRVAVLLFVFGVAPVLANSFVASTLHDSFASTIHNLYDVNDEGSAVANVSQTTNFSNNDASLTTNENASNENTSEYYYDDNFTVTFADVLEGFKGTFKAMTTLPR